jgi:hypothetical protein
MAGVVIIPWNNLAQWGIPFPVLTNNELYIKGGIGAFFLLMGLVFLIISIHDQNNYGEAKSSVMLASVVPIFMMALSAFGYAIALIWYIVYRMNAGSVLLTGMFYGLIFIAFNVVLLAHFGTSAFRKGSGFKKIMVFFVALELMAAGGFAGYFMRNVMDDLNPAAYSGMYTYMYFVALAAAILIYIIHMIIIGAKSHKTEKSVDLEESVKEIRKEEKESIKPTHKEKNVKKEEPSKKESGNKTMIVSKEQTIISGEQDVDPTQVLYEDVAVDSEFNKTTNADKQVSSIEYYIEKPKMFKPLDPAFDQLVAHVRELPNVVTKLADERITFYVDRKPFLVLMNFGNYYRMAFRSELEKGIRLIIKYPTISKNKGTKDNLWFKANNYGDLPKDVIYDIVKTAYDNVHA